MTAAHPKVAPKAQPAKTSSYPDGAPRTNAPFPIREAAFPKPSGVFSVHPLRSPPMS